MTSTHATHERPSTEPDDPPDQPGAPTVGSGSRPPPSSPPTTPEFVITKQHRRFAEFCDAVRRDRYIGLCHGAPGVGKTLSARYYSRWDTTGPALEAFRFGLTPAPELSDTTTIFYTPKVHNTPRTIEQDVRHLHNMLSWAIETTQNPDRSPKDIVHLYNEVNTELIIVDEADRLKTPAWRPSVITTTAPGSASC